MGAIDISPFLLAWMYSDGRMFGHFFAESSPPQGEFPNMVPVQNDVFIVNMRGFRKNRETYTFEGGCWMICPFVFKSHCYKKNIIIHIIYTYTPAPTVNPPKKTKNIFVSYHRSLYFLHPIPSWWSGWNRDACLHSFAQEAQLCYPQGGNGSRSWQGSLTGIIWDPVFFLGGGQIYGYFEGFPWKIVHCLGW